MSFTQMKRDDLYNLATENFAVDVEQTATKNQIIAALAENGVTWDMAKVYDQNAAAIEEVVETPEPAAPAGVITAAQTKAETVAPVLVETEVVTPAVSPVPQTVIVKMERENPTYMVNGYKFTRANPYVVVAAKDVDHILSHEWGFKIASPREVQEFYG